MYNNCVAHLQIMDIICPEVSPNGSGPTKVTNHQINDQLIQTAMFEAPESNTPLTFMLTIVITIALVMSL